jgi:hypothetical protein
MRAIRSLALWAACGLLVGWAACALAPRAQGKGVEGDVNVLSMEVIALQALHQLRATPAQLEELKRLAAATAEKVGPRRQVEVSDKFHKTLAQLRDALIEGKDERIDELNRTIDELREKEQPELDDFTEISDAARREAPALLRRFSARQAAGFLADFAENFPDPVEMLTGAFAEVRKLSRREWGAMRDDVAEQVGWLVAGLDEQAEEKAREQAAALITRARQLKDAELKKQRPELEKAARELAGKVGPTDVHRHFLEHALAELLSNPRLGAAVEARLKQQKK